MRIRTVVIGSLAAALAGVATWLSWRWVTTPAVPEIALDRTDEALVELVAKAQEEVRRKPRSGEAWGKLGVILLANYVNAPALECLVNAERFDPRDPRWSYLRGDLLLQGGRLPEGIASLQRALTRAEAKNRQVVILFRLALILIREGQLDEAEARLQALQAMDPDGPQVEFGRGLLGMAREDWVAARGHLLTLTTSPFAQKKACTLLATLASADRAAALRYQEQASRLPPDLPWPDPFMAELSRYCVNRVNRFGLVVRLRNQGDLVGAQRLARQLVAERPDAEIYLTLVHILTRLHQLDEAEQMTRTVIRIDPGNGTAQLALGQILLQKGEQQSREPGGNVGALELYRQAVEAEDRALALGSDHFNAHMTRGRALAYLGRTEEALQALRQGVLCGPGIAETHLALGDALAEAGQVREALEHLENAVRLASENDQRPQAALEKWRAKAKLSPY